MIYPTQKLPNYSYAQLRTLFRGSMSDGQVFPAVLRCVQFINRMLPSGQVGIEGKFNVWQLTAFIAASLDRNLAPGQTLLGEKELLQDHEFFKLLEWANGMSDDVDSSRTTKREKKSRFTALIAATFCIQTSLQYDLVTSHILIASIFGFSENNSFSIDENIDQLFHEFFGVNVMQYYLSLYKVLGVSGRQTTITRQDLIQEIEIVIGGKNTEKILDDLILRAQDFSKYISENLKSFKDSFLIHALFNQKPLIEFPNGVIVFCPNHFMKQMVTSRIFHKFNFLRAKKERQEKGDKTVKERNLSGKISSSTGDRFHRLISDIPDINISNSFIPEFEYRGADTDAKSSDWIVEEKEGSGLVFIEAKLARVFPTVFFNLEASGARKLSNSIAEAICQVINFLRNMAKTNIVSRLDDDRKVIAEKCSQGKKFFILLVFPIFPPVFFLQDFRHLVDEELLKVLKKRGLHEFWLTIRNNFYGWFVSDFESLSTYASCDSKRSLFKFLTKMNQEMDANDPASHFGGIKNWAITQSAPTSLPESYNRKYEDFIKIMQSYRIIR